MSGPKDDVLRASIYSTLEGETRWRIHDVIDRGDAYEVVLLWGSHSDHQGVVPWRSARGPKETFEVVSDPNCKYELRCKSKLNFDAMPTNTVPVNRPDELWKRPDGPSLPPMDLAEREPVDRDDTPTGEASDS
jgi:hypothetical protein